MNIREMNIEELELLSYKDIAYRILKSDKTVMTTPVLFTEVCNLLNINKEEMLEKIGDFYTSLLTDKRFILLDNVNWDLKENHSVKPIIEDDIDDELSEEDVSSDEEEDEIEEETEDEIVQDDIIDEDFEEDGLEDLVVIGEDEIEE